MDPLTVLPAEIVLRVLDFASLGSLAALTQTSRTWHDFIDNTHQDAIYAARVPNASPSVSPETHFSGLATFRPTFLSEGIKSWKEACRRRNLLAAAWNSSEPRPTVSVIQVGTRPVWRFKPDFKRRIIVSTSQAGGVNVTDMDRGNILWSLVPQEVRPFAHLEYLDGTAVWDRFGNALEVWKTDLPGCGRGEFRRVALLPHDAETRGFQLSFDTLSVVSTEGEGFVYDVPPTCPDLPVTLRTQLNIAHGAIGHLDQDRDVVVYSMGSNGYHFHDKTSGELCGIIHPKNISEAETYHIVHPERFLSDPNSIVDIIGGLGDMLSTQSGSAPGPQTYRERFTPIQIRPGHLTSQRRPVDPQAEAQHSIPPIDDDEWGAGMLKGNTMVGVSRGGRLIVCWDWRRALRSPQDLASVAAVVECEPSGDSNFDLGGWLSIHETVGGKRVLFEVKERIYILSLGDEGKLVTEKTAFAIAPSIAPQITVPVSFMAVYDDCLMSTFTTLGLELEDVEDDEEEEQLGSPQRERYFPTKAIRSKYNAVGGGESISFLELANNQYHYCCGSYVTNDTGTVTCLNQQSSFVLGDGQLMYGYAALENATLDESSTTGASTTDASASGASTASAATSTASSASDTAVPASSQCDDSSVKIGAGVGVPLGAVALMAVAWALWERRKAAKSKWAAVAGGEQSAGVAGGGDQSAAVAGGRDQSGVVAGGADQSAGVVAGGDHYPYYQYQQPYPKVQGQGGQGDLQFAQQARGPMAELQHTQPPWGPTAELHSQERPAEMMDRQSKGGVFSSATGF